MVHLRINQYWIREWLGACLLPGHCLNQWWSNSLMYLCVTWPQWVNALRPRQYGRHFSDILKCIFLNENILISIKNFIPNGPISNIPALVQIMAWCRLGDKPLSEPLMVSLLMHICVIRPPWVKCISLTVCSNNYVHDSHLIVFCHGQAMVQLHWYISWLLHWHWGNHNRADSRFCAQPMRDAVTLYRHLSLAGHKPRISPAYEAIILGLILSLHPAYERWRYFVTMSLIGWVQA